MKGKRKMVISPKDLEKITPREEAQKSVITNLFLVMVPVVLGIFEM